MQSGETLDILLGMAPAAAVVAVPAVVAGTLASGGDVVEGGGKGGVGVGPYGGSGAGGYPATGGAYPVAGGGYLGQCWERGEDGWVFRSQPEVIAGGKALFQQAKIQQEADTCSGPSLVSFGLGTTGAQHEASRPCV